MDGTTNSATKPILSLRERRAHEDREKRIDSLKYIAKTEASKFDLYGGYCWIDRDDLEVIGLKAIMDAVDTFDPSYGAKIQTYAMSRVRKAMFLAIQKHRNSDGRRSKNHAWIGFDNSSNPSASSLTMERLVDEREGDFSEIIVLKSLIESLPKLHREIVEMSVYDGLQNIEIAEILDYDKSRITVRLHEARLFLEVALNGDEKEIKHARAKLEQRLGTRARSSRVKVVD